MDDDDDVMMMMMMMMMYMMYGADADDDDADASAAAAALLSQRKSDIAPPRPTPPDRARAMQSCLRRAGTDTYITIGTGTCSMFRPFPP